MKAEEYRRDIAKLKGCTIAVVYTFEGEDAGGFQHYWIWKSNIISGWLNAIYELGCVPFILDVRTFILKAANRTLPHIDYILNLNCGNYELSALSVVPSICAFLGVPCIPCSSATIVMSENKKISDLLSMEMGLQTPRELTKPSTNGIYRPLSLGSSLGIKRGICEEWNGEGTYQEFIPGYDITIPVVYNPILEDIDLLPALLYFPKSGDPNWIYDAEEKEKDNGFTVHPILKIDTSLKGKILKFAKLFPISTFGRIDARVKSERMEFPQQIAEKSLSNQDFYFVEINSMPTIEHEDSFEFAFDAICGVPDHSFSLSVDMYKKAIQSPTIHGFLLSCSMLSYNHVLNSKGLYP